MIDYLADTVKIDSKAWEIGESIFKGILLEVAASPKPGLICHSNNGSHTDMSILTFMASSAAIVPAFYLFAQAGLDHEGSISRLLPTLKKIGIVYEEKLLKATKGVNTQRGILFSAGILTGAAGFCLKSGKSIIIENVLELVQSMTQGLVEQELKTVSPNKKKLTAGEQLYLQYGITGIRGEVEAGFPSIAKRGLPALKMALKQNRSLSDSLVHALISIMAELEDTTIIWRAGRDQLLRTQQSARNILQKGSIFTPDGRHSLLKLGDTFRSKGISPGGSADLLALTVGSYLLEKRQFPGVIL